MKLTVSNANISNTFSTARMTLANTNIVESISLGNVSVTPSQISVGSVSITPTVVSTPALILGGTQFSGGLQGGIINYQEFTANGTWYNPYANASVNSALTGYEQVLVMAWGGGGGATSNNNTTRSGAGGACVIGNYTLSAVPNIVSVTVGLGGTAARTTTTAITAAGGGGNTTFHTLTAYGGGSSLEGGGGWLSAGYVSNGLPLPGLESTFGGGSGTRNPGPSSIFGGGGGQGGGANGGLSIYGGGGGGSRGSSGTGNAGGISVFGGNGGDGNLSTAGSIPAGGGGCNLSSSNTGARGEVRVWVFGPAGTTAGDPTYGLAANTTTLYEGSSVLYTVSTTNVANGTTLYYTLNNSSTAVATDFTTAVNGSVVINGGTGTFILTADDDSDSSNETVQIDIRTNSTTGSIISSNSSVNLAPLPAVTVINRSAASGVNSNLTTYTFSAMAIGTASATRRVIAVISADDGSSSGRTLSSATIGGIAASIDVQTTNSTGGSDVTAIISATVPTGTTADIVATFSGGLARASCWVVSIDNLQSTTPYDTLSDATSPLSGTIDWLKDGFVVAGGATNSAAGSAYTWSGVTERFETNFGTSRSGGGDLLTTTTNTNQTISMTVSGGSPTRFTMVAASYR